MSKTNIVRYEFIKIDDKYYDIINNFRYHVDLNVVGIKNISEKDYAKYFSESPRYESHEIYLDQFIEFYNELQENYDKQIEKIDFLQICDGKNVSLDYIKIEVEALLIKDKVTILPFEKHFNSIDLIFGGSSYGKNTNKKVSTIKSTFVSNVKNIRPQNYNELLFYHYFGDHKSYYCYCELDHLLCKFRDDMNLKNVTILNSNSGIEFYGEDFIEENIKWNRGFDIFFKNDIFCPQIIE